MRETILATLALTEKACGAHVEAFAPFGAVPNRVSQARFLRDGEELTVKRDGEQMVIVLRTPDHLPSFEPTLALGDPAMDVMSQITRSVSLPLEVKIDPDANKGDICAAPDWC